MLEEANDNIKALAEATVAILGLISAALSIAFVYLVYVARALRTERHPKLRLFVRVSSLLIACAASLAGTGLLARAGWLAPAGLWLLVSGCCCVVVYWILIRSLVSNDARIPYTMMVWGGIWILALGAFTILWIVRDRIRLDDAKLSVDTLAQIASLTITAVGIVFTYIMKTDQSNRIAQQEIYQTLELQSIELFRFEAANQTLVDMLWTDTALPVKHADRYQVKQYICQMLNLFEMAYRFRVHGIMPPDVFGSWVIWIWELSGRPVFQQLWEDTEEGLPLNYIPGFRLMMSKAVAISDEIPGRIGRAHFFKYLANEINCPEVGEWLDVKGAKVAG